LKLKELLSHDKSRKLRYFGYMMKHTHASIKDSAHVQKALEDEESQECAGYT